MSEVKLIINQLNDAPRLFIDGQEVKGIVSIDYKFVTSGGKEQLGVHHYTISYVDDLNIERFNADPVIKTITVKKLYEDKSNYKQPSKTKGCSELRPDQIKLIQDMISRNQTGMAICSCDIERVLQRKPLIKAEGSE